MFLFLLAAFGASDVHAQPTNYSAASEIMSAPGWQPQLYPLPAQPPAIGGAGSYITDTSIPTNTRIMRITTSVDSPTGNSLVVPALGDRNAWSTDGTHALYMDYTWGLYRLLTLDLSQWPNPGVIVSKTPVPYLFGDYFSYIHPNLIYGILLTDGNTAASYDINTGTLTPLYNFTQVQGWNGGLGVGEFALSSDDRFLCGANGEQDTGTLVACFDQTTGNVISLNLLANTVQVNNGTPIPTTGYQFTPQTGLGLGVHELEFGAGNLWLNVEPESAPYSFWNIGGDITHVITETFDGGNHIAVGYNYAARGMGDQCNTINFYDARAFTLRPLSDNYNDTADWIHLDACPTTMTSWNAEDHITWSQNAGSSPAMQDKYPVFYNMTIHGPETNWLNDELVAFETDGVQEKVWHFFHNFVSPGTGCPSFLVGPHVSRDGRWMLFNSDWLGTLGAGADCGTRHDVFLAELKTNDTISGVTVTVNPQSTTLTGGTSQQFSAAVSGTSNTAVTWSVSPSLGQVSQTGLYVSPVVSTSQTVTITATSTSATASGSATVVLQPPVSVAVIPLAVSLTAGQTEQFAATVLNTANPAVVWTISPPLGSVSAGGLYTAPASVSGIQVVTVTATSVADGTRSSSAVVTLGAAISVSVSPGTAAFGPGGSQQFTATVANAANTSVMWTMSPSIGTLSSGGMYNGPASVSGTQLVTVTATSVADGTKSASAIVTLSPAVSVSVSPGTATLGPGGAQQFNATVANAANTAVTWSVTAGPGTVSAAGMYTAPASISGSQTATVTATSVADGTKSASAIVTLSPAVSVSVSPGTATLGPGGTQQFNATVANAANTAVTWTVTSGPGTVSASGMYTAPASISGTQTATVTATSVADGTKSASAILTLSPPVSVSVAPATATLNPGASQQFTATTINAANTAVAWAVTSGPGTVSAAGIYTAPASVSGTQTATVTATSMADGTKSASALVSISSAAQPVSVTVTPGAVTLNAGGSQQFTASVSNSSNPTVIWSVSPPLGTISSSGLYTAMASVSATQVLTVTATSLADGTKSGSAVVTIQPSATTASPFTQVHVNAGGPAYTDSQGTLWNADMDYSGGAAVSTANNIASTGTPALYQTGRSGSTFSYQFAVHNGPYTVVLKFAEISATAAGQRVFNVSINGKQVLTNFDIFAATGAAFVALDQSFPVVVTNGQVLIQFSSAGSGSPLINAIQIAISTGGGSQAPAFQPIRVDAGGGAYADSQGNTWSADAGFSGGQRCSTSSSIGNTADPALYQTCRDGGNFSYQFGVPNGARTVVLKFAEIAQNAAGKRVFNVTINGARVLANFDIFSAAGGEFIAVDKSFPVAVSNGQIVIQFNTAGISTPLVSAIEIM